jgi:hypothetical protein
VIGRGVDPGNSYAIAEFIFPNSPLGTALPAPAHVEAYAQGGLMFAVFVTVLLGIMIAAVARLRAAAGRSAVWHAFYIQSLVMLYYLTQTSIRGALWDSYGLYWSFIVSTRSRVARPVVSRDLDQSRLMAQRARA